VKDFEKSLIADICARCETLYFTAHLGAEFKGGSATGKDKAKGKETLYELASLYLWFEREPDKQGVRPNVPAAKVEKGRLEVAELVDGEVQSYSVLPARIPECTPKKIRDYFKNPAGKRAASAEERVKEEVMSADERLRLEVAKAEAERDAAQARAAVRQQAAATIPHAPVEENRNSPESWEFNFTAAIDQAKTLAELLELPPQIETARASGFIGDEQVESLKNKFKAARAQLTASA
jgi:hypothetical protein